MANGRGFKVVVTQFDVYGDGKVNTATSRTSNFVFSESRDMVQFKTLVKKAIGFIELTVTIFQDGKKIREFTEK